MGKSNLIENMWRPAQLVIASVCCAISFPVIGFKEGRNQSWLPSLPDQTKLDAERMKPGANWFHLQKDLLVNSVREDAEWWAKFLSFVAWSLISNYIWV